MIYYKTISSPVSKLKLVANEDALLAVLWENDPPNRVRLALAEENTQHKQLLEAEKQLNEYFSGKRTRFSLPLAYKGTVFQEKVWQALAAIPFAETRSYKQIAEAIGHPKAVRAVGAANGKNPLSIVIPCHRVLGTSGHLTGFAGGLTRKIYLLDWEQQLLKNYLD